MLQYYGYKFNCNFAFIAGKCSWLWKVLLLWWDLLLSDLMIELMKEMLKNEEKYTANSECDVFFSASAYAETYQCASLTWHINAYSHLCCFSHCLSSIDLTVTVTALQILLILCLQMLIILCLTFLQFYLFLQMATGGGFPRLKQSKSETKQRSSNWPRSVSSDKDDSLSLTSFPSDIRINNWVRMHAYFYFSFYVRLVFTEGFAQVKSWTLKIRFQGPGQEQRKSLGFGIFIQHQRLWKLLGF